MVRRQFWIDKILKAWTRRSVVWLYGVRRAGKTMLCQSLPGIDYFDCELPSVRRQLADPEGFLRDHANQTIALDEIHRLPNPSELLKVAADHFPTVRIVATGSSTLGASIRFRDTLAGRKEEVWLTPMTLADLHDFGSTNLRHRLEQGGLPPFFLAGEPQAGEFQEWLDAYWARDVLELFRLDRRHAFQRLAELVMTQSGGIFEATSLARACEISRPTVATYVAVLEATHFAHLVRPFASRRATEIVSAPRVYAFDTGFVRHYRGWRELRPEDLGMLWEHLVLNELHAHLERGPIHYWRTKHGSEVDFVVSRPGAAPTAIECKWSADQFDAAGIRAFRRVYQSGDNYVVAADVVEPFSRTLGGVSFRYVSLAGLIAALAPARDGAGRGMPGTTA